MSFSSFMFPIALVLAPLVPLTASAEERNGKPAATEKAADLDGAWEIGVDGGSRKCRVLLRAQPSDNGDYFLGMPTACRHTIPDLVKVGRWTLPDATHLTLTEPTGTTVLKLAAADDAYVGTQGGHSYNLRKVDESGRSAAALKPIQDSASGEAPITLVAKRSKVATAEAVETPGDLAGRYAIMRDKRDTGCMLTLDRTRTRGGTSAHLAPGCRDQGIVIFDPAAWQLVKGDLVLTARAGHKAHLLKNGDGAWAKDPKDGGKPLGLKKL